MAKADDSIPAPISQSITALSLALSVVEIAVADLTHQIRTANPQEVHAIIELLDAAEQRREDLALKIIAAEARCPSESLEKLRAFIAWQKHCV